MTESEILQKNIKHAERLRWQADAIVLGQLHELVRLLSRSRHCLSPSAAAAAYCKAFPDQPLLSEMFAAFLQLLWEQKMLEPVPLYTPEDACTTSLIYYVPNSYTEAACKRFSSLFPHSVSIPDTDFQNICETTVSEENSFCVLPVSSNAEGELSAFSRMIHEYQLKTRAMCDVILSDGETELRLALLGKGICWTKDTAFVDISIAPESDIQLSGALAAFQKFGSAVHRITARPMEYNMNKFYYKITVCVCPENIHTIAAFVSAAVPAGVCGAFHIL